MRLLHATVIARYHSASVLAGFEPDACGVSRLVCQCQFKHGDDSAGMETHSRVSERLRQNSLLNCKAALGFSVGALFHAVVHLYLLRGGVALATSGCSGSGEMVAFDPS